MNERFQTVLHRGVQLLVYRPWWEEGVIHGMTMGGVDFRAAQLPEAERSWCKAMELSYLALPEQVHGREYLDLRSPMAIGTLLARHGSLVKGVRCDALIAPRAQVLRGSRVGFGVMSADCVPLLVRSKSGWAAIHAGWRGLACGVIANTLQAVEGIQEVAVFAAAGGGRYEVGGEVIEAIGPSAVHTTGHNGKFLLDTAQTALKQLQLVQPTVKAEVAGICTISDERFYSFRRQGQSCGRSLTFIIP